MDNKMNKFDNIINEEYCSGCGNCSFISNGNYIMELSNKGNYLPIKKSGDISNNDYDNILRACPFSNECKNETEIATGLYSKIANIKENKNIGYYLECYAGYVNNIEYRAIGGSGGVGTWMEINLLKNNYIDYVVHVREEQSKSKKVLFSYQISSSSDEIKSGAKSKYYPVEMSAIIKTIFEKPGRYLIVGVPCFIKAIRLLSINNEIIKQRVKYTIGLVCGHMKSDLFSKAIAWASGIHPSELKSIDFRVKLKGNQASKYGVKVTCDKIEKVLPISDLFVTNWGYELFKLKCCYYCDDVLAETADITIGDAWLSKYLKDSEGTNIIIIRNPEIMMFIRSNLNELKLENISPRNIYLSQRGGFRNKREGLAYRLYNSNKTELNIPQKRIKPKNIININRRNIYKIRMELSNKSFSYFNLALKKNDFNYFVEQLKPYIKKYNKLLNISILDRINKRINEFFK